MGYSLLALCWPLRALNYVSHPGNLADTIEARYVCKLLGHVYVDEPIETADGRRWLWCDRCNERTVYPMGGANV